jgi:peptide/nickel transport system substrate-binding protein
MGALGGGVSADDVYTEGSVGKINVLSPLYASYGELDRDITSLVFSGLMKYDSSTGKMIEDLATMKVNENQTLYTFTLRENAYFHNGDLVTAGDVYFTYHDVIQSPDFANAILATNFSGVDITKKDERTLEFRLPQPNSFFLTNLNIGILPQSVYGDIHIVDLLTSEINTHPVGSGPYSVDRPYSLNSRGEGKIILKRFEKYYGGLPHIKAIVYRTFVTPERLLDSQDELNAISKLDAGNLSELNQKRFASTIYMLPQYKAAFFNMDSLITGVKSVRLAMLKSIDKTKLMELVPGRIPVDTPFMELNQEDWVYQSDIEEARGALYDAGYRYPAGQKSGFRKTKKGNSMRIRLAYLEKDDRSKSGSEDEQIAAFLKSSWEAIGIEVELFPVPSSSRQEFFQSRDYDVLLAGQSLGYDLDTYFFWHTSQATSEGSNLSNYKNYSADVIIEDIRRYLDETRKNKRLGQLAKIVKEDIPAVFLFRPKYVYASDGKISGMDLSHISFPADRFSRVQSWVSK